MSAYDYTIALELESVDVSFRALIMAAMRRADPENLRLLKGGWPDVWEELHTHMHGREQATGRLVADTHDPHCRRCGCSNDHPCAVNLAATSEDDMLVPCTWVAATSPALCSGCTPNARSIPWDELERIQRRAGGEAA